MGTRNPRGQCALEAAVILMIVSAVAVTLTYELKIEPRSGAVMPAAQLSQGPRPAWGAWLLRPPRPGPVSP